MGDDCGNIYQLRPVSIIRSLPQIKDHRLFQLKLEDGTTWESFGHQPGQFIEVSIFACTAAVETEGIPGGENPL